MGARREELSRVYREHVRAVYAFVGYGLSREVAEDLTAATFERVVRSWESYDAARASERTWILTIARNLVADHYRRESHRAGPSLDDRPALLERLAAPDAALERLEQGELRAWLAPLGERERQVLGLRFAADLATAEIAEVMDLSVANVQQILSRTLRGLRGEMEEAEALGAPAQRRGA